MNYLISVNSSPVISEHLEKKNVIATPKAANQSSISRMALSVIFLFLAINCLGQSNSVEDLDQQYLNWYNKDLLLDNKTGASVDRTFSELIKDKTPIETVIVAVIDGGVDIDHEDLEGQIWINQDEIPGNNIDDDHNGYVDDIHGWNYIGNEKGENIVYENLEFTRILRQNNENHPDYQKSKLLYEKELDKRKREKTNILKFETAFMTAVMIIKENTGVIVKEAADLEKVKPINYEVASAKSFLEEKYDLGFTQHDLDEIKIENSNFFNFFLNQDYAVRSLVGDDPMDIEDIPYGNADVKGPRSDHGTSVAGIIAALRDNGVGIDGIAPNVKIMSLRTTPRGDERDKDVALAIRYAVDNGARIINMSFGKEVSPEKKFVDAAVKYAEEHDVLLVHGSGNSGLDIDVHENYPSDRYADGVEASNWLNVGAISMTMDKYMAAVFSNYGSRHVDIFAPGVDIISLDSTNSYSMHDGTSVAAPVVSGVAALLLSYYPELSAPELIDILLVSSYKDVRPRKVYKPDLSEAKPKKVRFSELSKSGGIVNAYEAFLEAERRQILTANSERTSNDLTTIH